ncbi:MAG: hypothetical protein HZC28_10520 [Spirochaetes bacterium]|nr:hypothetical protein [Spirochaetota bacterium]
MKKFVILMALAAMTTSLFAIQYNPYPVTSVKFDTTVGRILNDLDRLQDPMFILDVKKSTFSLKTPGTLATLLSNNGAELSGVFGIVNPLGLPMSLGILGSAQINATTPGTYQTTTASNLAANIYTSTVTSFESYQSAGANKWVAVGGFNLGSMPVGIRAFVTNGGTRTEAFYRTNATFGVDTATAQSSVIRKTYDTNAANKALLDESLKYKRGFNDSAVWSGDLTAAAKMMDMWCFLPILFNLNNNDKYAEFNYTLTDVSNSSFVISNDNHKSTESTRILTLGVEPHAYLPVNANGFTTLEVGVGASYGIGYGDTKNYTETTENRNGATTNKSDVSMLIKGQDGYLAQDYLARAALRFKAKEGGLTVSTKFWASYALNLTGYKASEKTTTTAENIGVSKTVTRRDFTSSEFSSNANIITWGIPVGVEYAFNDVFCLRMGGNYKGTYTLANTTTKNLDYKTYQDNYNAAGTLTSITTNTTTSVTRQIDTVNASYVSSYAISFGAGFTFSENFMLDLMMNVTPAGGLILAVGPNGFLDVASWNAQFTYRFGGAK